MRTENPWAGLASYQDPAVAERKMLFCGRENESQDLAELIEDNIFVTLYGKSGTGKTSLLNAGVFPLLRKRGFIPVSIRLGMEAHNLSFQSCIRGRVLKAVLEQGSVKSYDVVPEQKDEKAQDYLWTWFACRKFLAADGSPVFPVLVFDQFEEVFRERSADAEVLLRQINFLMDSSHQLPSGTVDGEPYEYDYNFRFLVSLREDDLYHLEDSIDNNYLPEMKHCRFRLRSLTEKGAREVILNPGGGLFGGADQETIVQTILKVARSSADNSISTNLLSLLCSRIFDEAVQSGTSQVSLEQVQRFVGGNPIIRFYQEATSFLTDTEREYLEDSFVDSSGRRNSVSEEEFLRHVKDGTRLLEGSGKILQRTSVSSDARDYRIELIHDSFCAPLAELREARLQRNRTRKRATFIGVSAISLAIVLLVGLYMYSNRKSLRRYQEMQTQMITAKARELLKDNKSYDAVRLLLEVLPSNLSHPDRPVPKETLELLKEASGSTRCYFGEPGVNNMNSFAASDDWQTFVTCSRNGDLILWRIEDGFHLSVLADKGDTQNRVAISGDGQVLAFYSQDVLTFWDIRDWAEAGLGKETASFRVSRRYDEEQGLTFRERRERGIKEFRLQFVPGTHDVVCYGPSDTLLRYSYEEHRLDTLVPVKGQVLSRVEMSEGGKVVVLRTHTPSGQPAIYMGEGLENGFHLTGFHFNGDYSVSRDGKWLAWLFPRVEIDDYYSSSWLYVENLSTGKFSELTDNVVAFDFSQDNASLCVWSEDEYLTRVSLSEPMGASIERKLSIDGFYANYDDILLLNPEKEQVARISDSYYEGFFEIFTLKEGDTQDSSVQGIKELTSLSGIWDSSWHVEEIEEEDETGEVHSEVDEEIKGEEDSFQHLVYLDTNQDKSRLAISYSEGAQIWDTRTDSLLFSRVFHPAHILTELRFDPSGNVLTLHASGTLRRWRPDMSECLDTLKLAQGSDTLTSMCYSPDGSRLYVMGYNGFYTLDGKTLDSLSFYPRENRFFNMKMNSKGNRMVCFGEKDAVVIHVDDPSKTDTLIREKAGYSLIHQAVFSGDDNDLMLVNLMTNTLLCYHTPTWDCSPVELETPFWGLTGACEYLDSNTLIVARGKGVTIVKRKEGQPWKDKETLAENTTQDEQWANVPTGMIVLPKQNRVIVAYYNGKVYSYECPLSDYLRGPGAQAFDPAEYQPLLDACRERFKRVKLTPEEKKEYYLDL